MRLLIMDISMLVLSMRLLIINFRSVHVRAIWQRCLVVHIVQNHCHSSCRCSHLMCSTLVIGVLILMLLMITLSLAWWVCSSWIIVLMGLVWIVTALFILLKVREGILIVVCGKLIPLVMKWLVGIRSDSLIDHLSGASRELWLRLLLWSHGFLLLSLMFV
jgi:hypothetical protein